jgi:SAM-dependent methyltransferase
MSRAAGLARVARFNWPWYAAALATLAAGLLALRSPALPPGWATALVAALALAAFWGLASLAVSHLVYDRSGVARGAWLDGIDLARVRRAAVFHAGHDEASAAAARVLGGAELRRFDVHDPARGGTPSLRRARALASRADAVISIDRIPLEDATLDLGLLVFAAHEIRRDDERVAFFGELARVLSPAGRLVVVEHLRDAWNLLAYGPGALHFFPRGAWVAAFDAAGLAIERETRCTPFVRVFELARAR